jgi:Zn-dependent protease with chaperone function
VPEISPDGPPSEAVFLDGAVNKKRAVTLRFGPALEIVEDGAMIACWPYGEIRRVSVEGDLWRLHALGAPELARLELRDPALQARVASVCLLLNDQSGRDVSTKAVIFWSLAAVASIVGMIWFIVPYAADAIAERVPLSLERRLGEAADNQIRAVFPGKQCDAPEGAAALRKLSDRLQAAADLRMPADIVALSSKTPNAFALPGGKIYLLSGLLAKAQSQDEIAGVLAHELGHLQHRDHIRRMVANGGAAYLIGVLFGDVTGGGALIFAGKTLLFAAYSREAEAQADAFAAQVVTKLGRPAKPMGELLERLSGEEEYNAFAILHDHPLSKARLEKLAAVDKGATGPALLSAAEWKALKTICAEAPPPEPPEGQPNKPDKALESHTK